RARNPLARNSAAFSPMSTTNLAKRSPSSSCQHTTTKHTTTHTHTHRHTQNTTPTHTHTHTHAQMLELLPKTKDPVSCCNHSNQGPSVTCHVSHPGVGHTQVTTQRTDDVLTRHHLHLSTGQRGPGRARERESEEDRGRARKTEGE